MNLPRNDPYNPMPGPAGVPRAPTAGNNSVNSITSRYGLGASDPMMNPSAGAGKPFSNYTTPNGYSPWQNLYLPSANGTISPYTSYVQPALNQQNFNAHMSEQINGVRTGGYYGSGTPGMESNIGSGNGLVNPSTILNYKY